MNTATTFTSTSAEIAAGDSVQQVEYLDLAQAGGRVRVRTFSFTTASALANNTPVELVRLPGNSTILGGKVQTTGLGNSSTNASFGVDDGTAAPAALAANRVVGTLSDPSDLITELTSQKVEHGASIYAVISGGTRAAGTLTGYVLYVEN